MFTFDLIAALATGYRMCWHNRVYLAKLAAGPFVLALLNSIVVDLVLTDLPPLRRALLLLPAMVAEAWLVAQFLRTMLTGEVWPQRVVIAPGQVLPAQLLNRVRGLMGGILVYLLIALVFNALAGIVTTLKDNGTLEELIKQEDPLYGLVNLVVLFLMIRFFAVFWAYLPLIANQTFGAYWQAVASWRMNVNLLALWLLTILPLLTIMLVLMGILAPLAHGDDAVSFVAFLVLSLVATGGKFIVTVVSSTVIATALLPVLLPKRKT